MVDRHDPEKAREIFGAMRDHGVFYVPTHLTRWSDAYADQPVVREDPALQYLHPLMKMQWLEDLDAVLSRDPTPAARQAYVDFYRKGLALTAQAHASGVRIMVGTDYIAAGLDVHRELEQLVLAGLTPHQALQAAITTPVEYAEAAADYGEVTPGRIADLVLLSANPLADIRHTQRIEAVVFNGTAYGPEALERIKGHVRSNARSWTIGAKMIWRFVKNPASY
jgi:imidazolonepropionase-like amidohydrolase